MVATAQDKKQKELTNASNVRAFAFGEQAAIKPVAQVPAVQGAMESGLAFAERTMRKPTKAMARALRIGDIIEAYYLDDINPVQHIVIEPCESDGAIYDVRTITNKSWESGKKDRGPTSMNTEYWKKVGRMLFNVGEPTNAQRYEKIRAVAVESGRILVSRISTNEQFDKAIDAMWDADAPASK